MRRALKYLLIAVVVWFALGGICQLALVGPKTGVCHSWVVGNPHYVEVKTYDSTWFTTELQKFGSEGVVVLRVMAQISNYSVGLIMAPLEASELRDEASINQLREFAEHHQLSAGEEIYFMGGSFSDPFRYDSMSGSWIPLEEFDRRISSGR